MITKDMIREKDKSRKETSMINSYPIKCVSTLNNQIDSNTNYVKIKKIPL